MKKWQSGFGTRYAFPHEGSLPGDELADQAQRLPVDLAANAESLGAHVIRCKGYDDVVAALKTAANIEKTTVIYVKNDRLEGVPGYDSWWDVPVAEVSEMPEVQARRREWEQQRAKERLFLGNE